jgi:hypothetical protein
MQESKKERGDFDEDGTFPQPRQIFSGALAPARFARRHDSLLHAAIMSYYLSNAA